MTEDGEVVDDSLEDDPQTPAVETRAVTIVANTSAATFSLPTEPDTDWEEHSNVTVAVADGTDYSISTNAGSASVAVQDDDLPASTVTLAVSPTTQDEGNSVTATLTLRTRNPGQLPHGGSGANPDVHGDGHGGRERLCRARRADHLRVLHGGRRQR